MPRFIWLDWLKNTFISRRGRPSRRPVVSRRPRRAPLRFEQLEDRTTPSANLQAGGVIHLPFTALETEGSAGATVVSTNGAVNPTLLDFTDPTGTVNDYNITVNWGDGSAPQTFLSTNAAAPWVVTSTGGAGPDNFHVVPTSIVGNAHVYDEAPAGNQIIITVTDVGSGASTGPVATPFTAPLHVADAALTDTTVASGLPNPSGVEGVAIPAASAIIATFDDANPLATAADYTVSGVTWPAGVLSASVPVPTYSVVANGVSGGSSHWKVEATGLVFADEGSFNLMAATSVTVTDNPSTVSIPAAETPTFNISDAALNDTSTGATVAGPAEGASSGGVVLGTFSDNNPFAPASDYTGGIAVVWPAGANESGATYTVNSLGNTGLGGVSNWQVIANTISFSEEGTFTPTSVSITDVDGSTTSLASPNHVTVAEVQITNLTGGGSTQSINEGGTSAAFTGLATFTDPAGAEPVANYTTLIHWGDGGTSAGTVVNVSGNNFRIDAPAHTYAEEGSYSVTVDVTHETAATLTVAGATINVAEVQISNLAGGGSTQSINEGGTSAIITGLATFTDPAGASPVADYTADSLGRRRHVGGHRRQRRRQQLPHRCTHAHLRGGGHLQRQRRCHARDGRHADRHRRHHHRQRGAAH